MRTALRETNHGRFMGFRVNTNIDGLRTLGNLGKSRAQTTQSIERLSSGLKINRGADDAASLTVSEKLRGQIRGLSKAIGNAQDGISLVQTAEGALNEDHAILNRMRELSVQSQSDALTSTDRIELQKEVDQMVSEIDRIATTTEFNTRQLLDGSVATRHTSSDGIDLDTFETDNDLATGDYHVALALKTTGTKEVQTSATLQELGTGRSVTHRTRLSEIEGMQDNQGNSFLESPQTLTIRGNKNKTEVIMSSNQTLEEFSLKVENAISASVEDGGLGISKSSFSLDTSRGQLKYTAGNVGRVGEISFSASEGILNALSFNIQTESEAAVFEAHGIETGAGIINATRFQAEVSTNDTFGVVGGLELDFNVGVEARIDGNIPAVDAIQIGNSDAVFTLHDTNGGDNNQATGSISAGVTLTLTANRTFLLTSISTMINNAVGAANDPTDALTTGGTSSSYTNPNITASFSGYNLVLTSSATGSSGEISILANAQAQTALGLSNGLSAGAGGSVATITGGTNIIAGATFAGGGVTRIRLGDGDFNTNNGASVATDITFNQGVLISAVSITTAFNNYFTANGVKATAALNGGNQLEITSTENGSDSRVSIVEVAGATLFGAVGIASGASGAGAGGTAAVFTGSTGATNATKGFTLSDFMSFTVTDSNSIGSGIITLGTANTSSTGESFSISTNQMTSIIDASNIGNSAIDYGFTNDVLFSFFQREPGGTSSIQLQADSASVAVGGPAFGINFNQTVGGENRSIEYDIRVVDNSLKFEVGANQSQTLDFGVINTSANALGLKGLDLTSFETATTALGQIDEAIKRISSERNKLGSIQNRLGSVVNNNTQTHTNLQSFESGIRDTDLAKETLKLARANIMTQAATTQVSQAKVSPQAAMQLLG
jgi:flagellin